MENYNKTFQENYKRVSEYHAELEKAFKKNQELTLKATRISIALFTKTFMKEYKYSRQKSYEIAIEIIEKSIQKKLDKQSIYSILTKNDEQQKNIDDDNEQNNTDSIIEKIPLYVESFSVTYGLVLPFFYIYSIIGLLKWRNESVKYNDFIFPGSRMTVKEIFDVLKTMPKETALSAIQKINCSPCIFDTLVDCVKTENQDKFNNIIYENNIDVTGLSSDCYLFQKLGIFSFIFRMPNQIEKQLTNEHILDIFVTMSLQWFQEMVSVVNPKISEEEHTIIKSYPKLLLKADDENNIEDLNTIIFKMIRSALKRQTFIPKEWEIINRIIKNPRYADVYDEIFKPQIEEATEFLDFPKTDSEDNICKEFTLPDNYFDLQSNANDRICMDDIKTCVINLGTEAFKKFINYIAEQEYIENNIQTKESFAYRLTGRHKPDNLLKKIEWNTDKDSGSYRLYYIVKQFYWGNGRKGIRKENNVPTSKYHRIKLFFICDKYTGDPSTYANKVPQDFKTKLEEFFTKEINDNNPVPQGLPALKSL